MADGSWSWFLSPTNKMSVSASKTAGGGRARNVRARRCRVREFRSIWQQSGHIVSSPVSRNSSQEILPPDGRTLNTVSLCDRDSEGYVTTSLQSQLFLQYVNVSETHTRIPVVILRPKWNFLSPKVKIRFQFQHLFISFAYKVKI